MPITIKLNNKFKVSLLLILILTINFIKISTQQPNEIELIRNGDFSSGILYWNLSPRELFVAGPTDIHSFVGPFIGPQMKGDNALLFSVKEPGVYNGSISQSFYFPQVEKATLTFTVIKSSILRDVKLKLLIIWDQVSYDVAGTLNLKDLSSTQAYDNKHSGSVDIYNLKYDLSDIAKRLGGRNVTLVILFSLRTDYYAGEIYFDDISVKAQSSVTTKGSPRLEISHNFPSNVDSGSIFDVTVSVKNTGSADAINVSSFLSWSGEAFTLLGCTSSLKTDRLKTGESLQYTCRIKAGNPGTHTVEIKATGYPNVTAKNTIQVIIAGNTQKPPPSAGSSLGENVSAKISEIYVQGEPTQKGTKSMEVPTGEYVSFNVYILNEASLPGKVDVVVMPEPSLEVKPNSTISLSLSQKGEQEAQFLLKTNSEGEYIVTVFLLHRGNKINQVTVLLKFVDFEKRQTEAFISLSLIIIALLLLAFWPVFRPSSWLFESSKKKEKIQKRVCPVCGAPIEPGAKYCWRCGARLES
jgi:ribosomal protein L40E